MERRENKTNQHDIIIDEQRNESIVTIVNVKLNTIGDGISNCVFAFRNRISTNKTRIVYLLWLWLWFWHLFSLFDGSNTIAGKETLILNLKGMKQLSDYMNEKNARCKHSSIVRQTLWMCAEHERKKEKWKREKKAVLGLGHVFICCELCLFISLIAPVLEYEFYFLHVAFESCNRLRRCAQSFNRIWQTLFDRIETSIRCIVLISFWNITQILSVTKQIIAFEFIALR